MVRGNRNALNDRDCQLHSHLHPPTFIHPDWGWADVGFHREAGFNETVTPNMDALVKSGVLLNQYYVHKCKSGGSDAVETQRPLYLPKRRTNPNAKQTAPPRGLPTRAAASRYM